MVRTRCAKTAVVWVAFGAITALCACAKIGPDYETPQAPVADAWLDAGDERVGAGEPRSRGDWWTVFGDPVLDSLVDAAYRGNPTLSAAGARVLEALARRGVAVGTLFPQRQDAIGAYTRAELSENRANQAQAEERFDDWQLGFDVLWELDVWGRLRRNVEAADAEVLASIASYDDVLVTLVAEVARNYIELRTFEEALEIAKSNLEVQQRSFEIADLKFERGAVSRLDSLQAASLLEDTRAAIPASEARIRQSQSTLCFLLGLPPQDLGALLAGSHGIPIAPAAVATGIPADLLRRRPDVRRAERQLAAQSARIGIAKADYLPVFALSGTIALASEDFSDLFRGDSVEGFGGPSFRWAILNYGRISNNVRVQDARYQALVSEYESAVLAAQAEVEASIAAFLGADRQVEYLTRSVEAAEQAVDISDLQYREGAVDYTRVLNTQQFLVGEQNRLVATRGDVALSLTSLYKALGGGWEFRMSDDGFAANDSEVTRMRERMGWETATSEEGEARAVAAASEEARP